jgi:hypothetical protein
MPMLTRRISLSNGIEISTPLLIPSLSSRPGGPIPYQPSSACEPLLAPCSIIHSESLIDGIDESLLVSAYDVHQELLFDSNAYLSGFRRSRYAQPRFLFIDSGWYEKGGSSLDKQFGENRYEPLQWEESEFRYVIDNLDGDIRAIVVSWDHFGSYPEQIAAGQDFFGNRTTIASTILLKPPSNSGVHDFGKFSGEDFANLRTFDVIGVTELEIGESVLDRLININRLRRRLDDSGVESPIHIFGGLDPLYTPLYFAAGAELFDGLGWLRYAYREGIAMHRDTATILDRQITRRRIPNWMSVCLENLAELRRLSEDLRLFAHENHNWSRLSRGDKLESIYRTLQERLGV